MKQGTVYVQCISVHSIEIYIVLKLTMMMMMMMCVCVCRFEDAGHYYWLLAKSYLDHAKRSNTGQCVCVCVCVCVMVSFLDRTKW